MKKYIAEFLGTLVLALAVTSALGGTVPIAVPVVAGLALGIGVYTMGGISGAHFNPAITIGLAVIKKISLKDAGLYLAAQFLGAAASMQLVKILAKGELPVGVGANNATVLVAELLGAFVFAFGVAAVVHGKVSQGASGLAIGGSLLLGIVIAAGGSAGVLNPAVALAINSFSLSYLIGPVVGAVLAMVAYRYLTE